MTDERLQNAEQLDNEITGLLIKIANGLTPELAEGWARDIDEGADTAGAYFVYLYYCANHGKTIWKMDTLCSVEDTENDWEVVNVDADYEDFNNSVVTLINRARTVEDTLTIADFEHGEWLFSRAEYEKTIVQGWGRTFNE